MERLRWELMLSHFVDPTLLDYQVRLYLAGSNDLVGAHMVLACGFEEVSWPEGVRERALQHKRSAKEEKQLQEALKAWKWMNMPARRRRPAPQDRQTLCAKRGRRIIQTGFTWTTCT